MRIVAGTLKGHVLHGPGGTSIRPTSDRLRETIFNILAHAYGDPVPGAAILDLFAGTGALGIEALSRGASRALFIDNGAPACAVLRHNIARLGLASVARVLRRDARRLGTAPPDAPYSLAFLDPPYGKSLAEPALAALLDGGWLAPGALIIVEEAASREIALPAGVRGRETRRYGDTQIVIACLPPPD
jgi:16S rRNA (guanine966-N2)-methyltransferase